MEREKEERGQANELAEAVHEFWSFLMGEAETQYDPSLDAAGDSAPHSDLPVPSPDSITVTTEFGVTQEPNHFAVIVSTAPPPAFDIDDDVEHEPGLSESHSPQEFQLPSNSTAPPLAFDVHMELQATDMADDDEGHDADLDEDDLDAESALIDEFIDDGALTPVTATTTEAA
jgi:hypothetical protein